MIVKDVPLEDAFEQTEKGMANLEKALLTNERYHRDELGVEELVEYLSGGQ